MRGDTIAWVSGDLRISWFIDIFGDPDSVVALELKVNGSMTPFDLIQIWFTGSVQYPDHQKRPRPNLCLNHRRVHSSRLADDSVLEKPSPRAEVRKTPSLAAGVGAFRLLSFFFS